MSVTEGQQAPDFALPAADGNMVRLSDLRGKKVVLYFYPKDDTPGCTKEACSFRDNLEALQEMGVAVIGISPDGVASHQRFAQKYGLTFPLLADEGAQVAAMYGVWKEKKQYGRTYMGIERTTFLIDEAGVVRKVFPKVKVDGHVEEVIEAVRSLEG
ncbi:MAG: thioredoxin-dependent thiol peroxidase [Armatimonadota bacterium]|nr:thioredoxin-dependent thiol peroxidase [bacterium]MDW8320443.1 thioredoxin-dependent thiol peroxidase [Armatimonadota bacterium]